jgi:hypothetical protein
MKIVMTKKGKLERRLGEKRSLPKSMLKYNIKKMAIADLLEFKV